MRSQLSGGSFCHGVLLGIKCGWVKVSLTEGEGDARPVSRRLTWSSLTNMLGNFSGQKDSEATLPVTL